MDKTKSKKLQVVDEETFASYKSALTAPQCAPKINNSRYKRLNNSEWNLLHYVNNVKNARGCRRKNKRLTKRSGQKCTGINFVIYRQQRHQHHQRYKLLNKHSKTRMKKTIIASRRQKRLKLGGQVNELVNKLTDCRLKSNDVSMTSSSENEMEVDAGTLPDASCNKTTPILKKALHSRRFRSYCENCTTKLLCDLTEQFLRKINSFQHRSFLQNPIKAAGHRRYVLGFREVTNLLKINKLKMIIISTDCEECNLAGGPDDTIAKLKETCQRFEVPIVYALRRRQLSNVLFKSASISCVGILDFDGARDIYQQLLIALQEARESYQQLKKLYN